MREIHPPFPMKRFSLYLLPLLLLFSAARAQTIAGLDVQADNLKFEAEENVVTASGNVTLRKGSQSLKADVITYNTVTEQAHARGNVVFTDTDQIWKGEALHYNFLTGEGSFPDLLVEAGPFTVNAGSVERLGPVQTRLTDVVVTTCPDPVDPEFSVTSKVVDVYEEDVYLMRNAVFRLHGVPFFWVPRLTVDPEREPTHIDVIPGYGSRNGFMLLNSYNRYPAEGYRTKTHVDYRSRRGFGAGQDWFWYDPEDLSKRNTQVRIYGALDDAPYKNETQEAEYNARGVTVEEERYRIKLNHSQRLTSKDNVWAKLNYLSDPKVVDDFFDDEFRQEPIPETRAAYSTVGDGWNANLDVVMQLNEDDFESVNRLPEAAFNVPRRPIGNSRFQYESQTSGGFLEKTYTEFQRDNGLENYDSLRLHTSQRGFYSTKVNGWLNIVPRAGLGLTYYDTTKAVEDEVTSSSTVDENGVITTSFNTNSVETVSGGDIRLLPEIGFETSFKAFGIVHERPTRMGSGLRHVMEPYLDYTLTPEPDLTPEEIYQFDEIDTLGEAHNVAFGFRNKWQTRKRRDGSTPYIHDLVNLDIRTVYDLRSDVEENLGDVRFDFAWDPADWVRMRIRADYAPDKSTVDEMNSEILFKNGRNRNELRIDQRFVEDVNHTLQFNYRVNPQGRFGFNGYTRLELEEEGVEEQSLTFIIRTDCVGYGIGGSWQRGETYDDGTTDEDDYKLFLQFWLNAFPNSSIGTGGR